MGWSVRNILALTLCVVAAATTLLVYREYHNDMRAAHARLRVGSQVAQTPCGRALAVLRHIEPVSRRARGLWIDATMTTAPAQPAGGHLWIGRQSGLWSEVVEFLHNI